MANIMGKQYALNCISPMKPWKRFILQVIFWARQYLGIGASAGERLKKLSFIHFARWVIIKGDGFPFLGGDQEPEDLHYDYLLFCSNFNGTWDQYIDAFSDILPDGMDRIWRWSMKFPMAVPVSPFKAYIRHNMIDTDYYYCAYPGAAANDVKAAIHLSDELQDLAQGSDNMSPPEFQRAYNEFLTSVQLDLGATGPIPTGHVPPLSTRTA